MQSTDAATEESQLVSGPNSTSRGRQAEADLAMPFVKDLEPFFFSKQITYVDVGAFRGAVFEAFMRSQIKIRSAHLFEPNPKSFAKLSSYVSELTTVPEVHLRTEAVSSGKSSVSMLDNKSMSRILDPRHDEALLRSETGATFSADTVTLDEYFDDHHVEHINVLKIDVEGHELDVLSGCSRLLERDGADFIYIEVGLDKANRQLTYYRDVEDALSKFGYAIHHIYEQKNEWIQDRAVLRRANISFISKSFASLNPYRITQQLFSLQKEIVALGKARTVESDMYDQQLAGKAQELLELGRRFTDAEAALEASKLKIEKLTESLKQANAELLELRQEIADAKAGSSSPDDSLEAQRKLSDIENSVTDLDLVVSALEAGQLLSGSTEVERAQHVAKLEYRLRLAEDRYEAIVASTSWKMTSALRAYMNWYRRQRRPRNR